MKKALIFGSIFGLIFGIIEFVTVGFELSELYTFTGLISFIAYIICLIFILRQDGTKKYGERFLNGFIFSLMIGAVYGVFAGIAGFVYAENIAKLSQEGVEIFSDLGVSEEFTSTIESEIEPRPVYNLLSEIIFAIIFNAIFGSIFCSIFASFIKPEVKLEVEKPLENETLS